MSSSTTENAPRAVAAVASGAAATFDDLLQISDKAELVNRKIVFMPPTGGEPGLAGDEIYSALRVHAKQTGRGRAVSDNKGFRVRLPNRASFSPDAALYTGPNPRMRFYEGAPVFAVEVRSENDYGPSAEAEMAQKRRDYFEAGTHVVWDVDVLDETAVVRKYTRETGPNAPEATFAKGEIADAEPAVPGFRLPVDNLFDDRETL